MGLRRRLLGFIFNYVDDNIYAMKEYTKTLVLQSYAPLERLLKNELESILKEIRASYGFLSKKLEGQFDTHLKALDEDTETFKTKLSAIQAPIEAIAREALKTALELHGRVAALEATYHKVQYVPANIAVAQAKGEGINPIDATKELGDNLERILELQESLQNAQDADRIPEI